MQKKWGIAAATVAVTAAAIGFGLRGELTPARAADPNATPVVVELFTSEGCSSCPSADAVLEKLVKTQPVRGARIIALGQHVDYWNRLGWKDPYSDAKYTARHNAYAGVFKTDSVYTPQAVVDGQSEVIGSHESRVINAIERAAKQPHAKVRVSTEDSAGGVTVTVDVSGMPGKSAADVYIAVTEDNISTFVPSGENAGRRLSHAPVVRHLQKIGAVKAGVFNKTVPLPRNKGGKRADLSVAAFVQESESGRIVGAGIADL